MAGRAGRLPLSKVRRPGVAGTGSERDASPTSCRLDDKPDSYGTRGDATTDAVKVYARTAGGKIDRLQVLSATCPVETKTPIQRARQRHACGQCPLAHRPREARRSGCGDESPDRRERAGRAGDASRRPRARCTGRIRARRCSHRDTQVGGFLARHAARRRRCGHHQLRDVQRQGRGCSQARGLRDGANQITARCRGSDPAGQHRQGRRRSRPGVVLARAHGSRRGGTGDRCSTQERYATITFASRLSLRCRSCRTSERHER